MVNKIYVERREHPRYQLKEKCIGRIKYGINGKIINISLSGVLAELETGLKLGSECYLKIDLGRKKFLTKGTVAWIFIYSLEKETIIYHAGIQFQEMSKKDSQILEKFIRKLSSVDLKKQSSEYVEKLPLISQELEANI